MKLRKKIIEQIHSDFSAYFLRNIFTEQFSTIHDVDIAFVDQTTYREFCLSNAGEQTVKFEGYHSESIEISMSGKIGRTGYIRGSIIHRIYCAFEILFDMNFLSEEITLPINPEETVCMVCYEVNSKESCGLITFAYNESFCRKQKWIEEE